MSIQPSAMSRKASRVILILAMVLTLAVGYAIGLTWGMNKCFDMGIEVMQKLGVTITATKGEVIQKIQAHIDLLQLR